ncbi:MAG TPA: DNA repair protein RadA [Gammaproteobacteria bacterium]|nr:DNA repair protein RadA [Gammaproteobacteria bacterium]
MSRARTKSVYICDACGAESPKWSGQCADCGAWNTLVEARRETVGAKRPAGGSYAGDAGLCRLPDVSLAETARIATGFAELDRVLGGGLVPGSVTLLGGNPGIGKSTLLLQAGIALAAERGVLYVTGEESLQQVGLRARRLGLTADRLMLLAETAVERIVALAACDRPAVLIVDSVQTLTSETLESAPSTVAQLRECTAQLVRYAKREHVAVLLVGHVTKEGAIAGPRTLEHMVDAVLYFEDDAGGRHRVIRAVKNRFGAVHELAVFVMTETGLREVANPSAIFLAEHGAATSGSIVTAVREGSRPLLVEIQALVATSALANPRRVAVGLDPNRLPLLLAVLQRHGDAPLYDQDVFVNVVGGLRVAETAIDLPAALAVASSLRGRGIPRDTLAFGELGLGGEVRPVYGGEERLREAAKLGFRRAIVPEANRPRRPLDGLEVVAVRRLGEALALV